jgi:glutaminase
MYDYAGEWVYRVGIPAKSGVGGGIIASLPAQLGLGTFSPRLDEHGNSVRGLKICEELSSHFELHVLGRGGDVKTCINADYNIKGISSRRGRQPHEQEILDEHAEDIRIIELVGSLSFATIDYVSRQLTSQQLPQLVLLDFRRVPTITNAAARLLAGCLLGLGSRNTTAVLSGVAESSLTWPVVAPWLKGMQQVRRFDQLDDAIEWAEDQIVYRYGGYDVKRNASHLGEQILLAGLAPAELDEIAERSVQRTYLTGERIVAAEELASSLFFLQSGMVSVKLPSGVRLASLVQGMAFGEMSLIEERRTADVWADTPVKCLELPLSNYDEFCDRNPRAGQQIVRNLAIVLAKRLILANTKVELLTAS